MICYGCYTAIPEGKELCKTCEDRRKPVREVSLSDPNVLEPSQSFRGFYGPQGQEPEPVLGGFRDCPELDSEARLNWIVQGGFRETSNLPCKK